MRIDLSSIEGYVTNHLKLFFLSVAGLLLLVGIIAVSVFFIAVRGAEQTMVPDVRGKELTQALLELQVKELYPRLLLRYSQNSADKGLILEQEPAPGSITKAGSRIKLVVSQGVIINKVENFIGRNINDVRMDLQILYTSSGGFPLLSLKDPLMYDFSHEAPGTILAQKPEPGTDISGPISLELVISRGQENQSVNIPRFTGLDYLKALELIGSTGVNFEFNIRETGANEKGGVIVTQNPPASTVAPLNTVVALTMTAPEQLAEGEFFGLFQYKIPQNPYPLAVRLEAVLPVGERIQLLTVQYSGGNFTVPYKLPVGAVLVLSMLNRELYRETVAGYAW